jgi:hypothetical protein
VAKDAAAAAAAAATANLGAALNNLSANSAGVIPRPNVNLTAPVAASSPTSSTLRRGDSRANLQTSQQGNAGNGNTKETKSKRYTNTIHYSLYQYRV